MHSIEWNTEELPWTMVSLDETHLAIGYVTPYKDQFGASKVIRIINWETGGEFARLNGHSADVIATRKLEDKYFASGSVDTTIKIWQWAKAQLIKNLTDHNAGVTDLLAKQNFMILISCSTDMTIKVWNRSDGRVLQTLHGSSKYNRISLFLFDYLASSKEKGTIDIWSLTRAKRTRTLTGHRPFDIMALVNINQSRIASGALDWKIKIWSLDSEKGVKILSGHFDWISSLTLLQNGHLLSGSNDGTIRIWNVDRDDESFLIKTIFAHLKVLSLTLLQDGNLASGGNDGFIKIWHFEKNSTNYSSKNTFVFLFETKVKSST
jgi:WD40 repeat protein